MLQTKLSRNLLIMNSAILLACAVFDYAIRDTVLMLMLLFLPFIDRNWSFRLYPQYPSRNYLNLGLVTFIVLLCLIKPQAIKLLPGILLLTAVPEEWFFRVYYMQRLEFLSNNKFRANLITSGMFALLHLPTQGMFGLTVMVPALFMGWLYQKNRDFILLVLVHACFNLVFLLFIKEALEHKYFIF